MHVLEEAADDTGLTVQQVAVSYKDVAYKTGYIIYLV